MDRAGSKPSQRSSVRLSAVPLMAPKPVGRPRVGVDPHVLVAGLLGDHGGRGDGPAAGVAFHQGVLRPRELWDRQVTIHQDEITGTTGTAHLTLTHTISN